MSLSDAVTGAIARLEEAAVCAQNAHTGLSVVLDTNVLLDLYYWNDPRSSALLPLIAAGRVRVLRTAQTMAELADVLSREAFCGNLAAAMPLLERAYAQSVPFAGETATAPVLCRDPDDQKFLDLAHTAGAAWLVSRDRLVLKAARKLRRFGIESGTPEVFLGALTREDSQKSLNL